MSYPEVVIEQGTLSGSVKTSVLGEKYFSFQGVPYAKPPIGKLRFKSPQLPVKWTGVFDATKEGNASYGRDMIKLRIVGGAEDCLIINVYTKQLPNSGDAKLRPVLFWIHGGAFRMGSSGTDLYSPDFLLTEDVVLVTINYRLGLLGFLSLEDPQLEVSGNAGLKDMVMALKWVQKNIDKFGGDPTNVTIFGESSGGIAVHTLLLSPMSTGLYHKAIAQSGCVLNGGCFGKRGVKAIAAAINMEGADERTVYEYLVERSVEEIFKIQSKILINIPPNEDTSMIGVVVEENSDDAFLAQSPLDIILSGNFSEVPFMIGYTTVELMCREHFKNPKHPNRPNIEDIVLRSFGNQLNSAQVKYLIQKITKFYFGENDPSTDVLNKYIMESDILVIYGIYLAIKHQSRVSKAPQYLYRMSVESELNFFKKLLGIPFPGVCHLDDVGYLFNTFATPVIQPGSIEDISMRRFVRLWTNFAKYGNPTPDGDDPLLNVIWKPVTNEEFNFLDIGRKLIPGTNPEEDRIKFLEHLFDEYKRKEITV